MVDRPRRFTRWLESISTRVLGPIPAPMPQKLEVERGQGLLRRRMLKEGGARESYVGGSSMALQSDGIIITTVSGLQSYFDWYDFDVVNAAINALSEAAVGQGYHNKVDKGENKKSLPLVDELGEVQNFDALFPNICKVMLIAGFCPVDTRVNSLPSKCNFKIIHPATIDKFAQDKNNNILWIQQKSDIPGKENRISGEFVTWFVHNQVGNDLRGTSVIKPVESLLATKQTGLDNMDGIIDRKLYPTAIWKTTGSAGNLKNQVEQSEAGEDVFIGNIHPDQLNSGNLFEIVNVEGDTKYWEYIEYVDVLIFRGMFAPDQYYSRNATEASARVMKDLVDRNISAIQRNLKRAIEAGFYRRLMGANKIDVVPRLVWGVEKTGFEDLDMQLIILEGMRLGYIGPENIQTLIDQSGINMGKLQSVFIPEKDEEEPTEKPLVPPPAEEEPEEEEKLSVRDAVLKKIMEDLENE